MDVRDVLRGAATVAGQGYQGFALDEKNSVAQALAAQKAKLDADNARVLNTVRMAGIDPANRGRIAGAEAAARIPAAVDQARQLSPITTQTAVNTARETAPIKVDEAVKTAERVAPISQSTHAANRDYDNANPEPVKPSFTFTPITAGDGSQHVAAGNTKTGEITDTGVTAKAAGAGGATRQQRIQALANVGDALNSFEKTLSTTGSVIFPGAAKSGLQTDYENLQLQMKELYNLGVLNGPDLVLMRRIINDPTDLTGRALAFGSGDEQAKRIQAQIGQVREKIAGFQRNLTAGNSALSVSPPAAKANSRPPGFRP